VYSSAEALYSNLPGIEAESCQEIWRVHLAIHPRSKIQDILSKADKYDMYLETI